MSAARTRGGLRSDRGVVMAVVAMLVALVAGSLVWFLSDRGGEGSARAATRGGAGKPTATLRILEPGGTVQREGASTERRARDEQVLRQGDVVRSDATGMLEIEYADGSLTRLGPSTEFTIERLTKERGGRQTRGGLTVGETWSRAAKVTETGSFEVRAGGTTAAVEGTAFAFSCVGAEADRTCTVIDVVDSVRVTTTSGSLVRLTPATGVVSSDDVLGAARAYSRQELLSNEFIVENLALDLAAGKGLGLGDLPPPTTTPSAPGAIRGSVVPSLRRAPSVIAADGTAPATSVPPPPPPTTAPPPVDLRCTDRGWTRLVGADGQTFVDEQACTAFALAGGQFAVAGNGVFIVPQGAAVTLSATSDGACNTLQFGYSVQLDESTSRAATVGTVRTGPSCGGSLGAGTLPGFDTAVLLRVFLQDDTCGATRFFSDGNHAGPLTPSTVAIMDAGSDCSSQQTPREPADGNFDLVVTVSIGAQPGTG